MKSQRTWWVAGIVGLLAGWLGGASWRPGLQADPTPAPLLLNPQERCLDANLYVQTSAEYVACCKTIYRCATDRLHVLTASEADRGRCAVILDLDETVLDNSPFQTYLDRERLAYSDAIWEQWEHDCPNEVRLVPGALEFLREVSKLNVHIALISNRTEKNRASTIKTLRHLGIPFEDTPELLQLATTTSDKSPRRELVHARYRVLMLLGDNLRDFSETFAVPKNLTEDRIDAQIGTRKSKVEASSLHWGVDWFAFPNPVYGEWQKLYGSDPRSRLHPTTMKRPAAPATGD